MSRSTTRYRHQMRCGVEACRARFTLRRPPSEYSGVIKCPRCGDSLKVRDVKAERLREWKKRQTCHCNSYPFPHHAGSLRMCDRHPLVLAGVDVTEEEWQQYQALLETPRSGWSA